MNIVNIIERLKELQVFKYRPKRAVLNMSGPDARDFLQRMSTNDIRLLNLKQSVQTCFLNNKGRIIDYVIILMREVDNYALVSSFFDPTLLFDWIEQFHFVEDFSLEVSKQSCEWLIAAPGQLENPIWRSQNFDFAMSLSVNNYPELDEKSWELLRICALMPEEAEVKLALMPQNIGLGAIIAENKGCYLGQEVVAKALTYQKHVKFLAGIKLEPEIFTDVKVGDRVKELKNLGTHSGVLTSLAPFYMPDCAHALVLIDDKLDGDQWPAEFIFTKNYQMLA